LQAARQVADFASNEGVPSTSGPRRSDYRHAGALLADSILQAGLNYRAVVLPRVERILRSFPNLDTIGALLPLVEGGHSGDFLDWQHPVKISRFGQLVRFMHREGLDTTTDIREALDSAQFRSDLQSLSGVGPKTVDYMCCLVGIDSIAVDRHIKTFAAKAGLRDSDYEFLKLSFCFAADLLSISRREFDAWVWSRESGAVRPQLELAF
jgi:hypothetical protein